MNNEKTTTFDDDFIAGCRSNEGEGRTLEDWITAASNHINVEVIDEKREIWINGRCLSQAECNEIASRIENGV